MIVKTIARFPFGWRAFFVASTLLGNFGCVAQAQTTPQVSLRADASPAENGLKLDTQSVKVERAEADGQKAWKSGYKSVPADEWARSFLLTITDARFKNGQIPSVNVEIKYLHSANTAVEVKADTAKGSEKVASAWGNNPKWQTLKFKINNAYFGARARKGDPKALDTDGADLRINAWAGDFFLQSVQISALDPNAVDWTQALSVEKVENIDKFIVAPNGKTTLNFNVRNNATKPAQGTMTWELLDKNGKVLSTQNQKASIAANASTVVPFAFDSKGLETGVYDVRATLRVLDKGITTDALVYDKALVVATADDIFIAFDREPIMRGMSFDRNNIQATEVDADNAKRWAWQTTDGAERGADPWWKSVMFTVTDPRFVKGGRPAVDVQVTYRHTVNAPVQLNADTADGSKNVAGAWGNNQSWQTMYLQLDNAKFAQSKYGSNPKDLPTDGFDLRFTGNSGQPQIRSIFIRGFDLDKPDYRRLLRYDGLDAGRKIYVFAPKSKNNIAIKLRNLARLPVTSSTRISLSDDFGRQIWVHQGKNTIPAGAPFKLPVAFDTTGLKQGVYTLSLKLDRADGDRAELLSTTANVMVSETTPIGKSRPDEFQYGIDLINGTHQEEHYLWADFIGADIIRGIDGPNDSANLTRALARVKKYNLTTQLFFQPPWDSDPATLDRKIREEADRMSAIAREFGPQIKYYEGGNEPDLTFFYPGPMASYVKGYEIISRAIKAADPDSVIYNGGLCFAGSEADVRAREFIKLVAPDTIDAIAYHAHGPGSQAERRMHDIVLAEAKKWGKGDKPLLDTETGVAASTPAQLRMQARTAIQKLAYAQSVNLKLLHWFRISIDGGDGGYTNIINLQEPRPVILSYRTMARTMKGLKFNRVLDVDDKDAESYVFADNRGGNKRALVMWTNAQGGGTRTLNLGAGANGTKLTDLFGNALPVSTGNIVTVPLDNDPVFLSWNGGAPQNVAVLPSMLQVSALNYVTPGGDDTLSVTVKNPTSTALKAQLVLAPNALLSPKSSTGIAVDIAAKSSTKVQVPVTVSGKNETLAWPKSWTVFTDLPKETLTGAMLQSVPAELKLGGKTFKPQTVSPQDLKLDFATIGGGFGERKEAVAVAEVFVPTARTVTMGGSADWWMQWFVNGQPVFDTLSSGNGSYNSVLDHTFQAKLKAGRNVIAVRVLSGSMGWKLLFGGPDEVSAAKGDSGNASSASIELRQGEAVLARERINLKSRRIVQNAVATDLSLPNRVLDDAEPDGTLGDEIVNDFAKRPDSSKWWQGLNDLSARVWTRSDVAKLYVIVAVRDDNDKPSANANAIDTSDAVRIALSSLDGKSVQFGAVSGSKQAMTKADGSWTNTSGVANASGVVVESVRQNVAGGGTTWYRFNIDRAALPQKIGSLALVVRVNDDDFGGLKQFAQIPNADLDATKPKVENWWQIVLR